MKNKRDANRYELNYPIRLSESASPADHSFLAQILDAGLDGMRLLMAGANPLQRGCVLHLCCAPARENDNGQEWHPVQLCCKVAWQNLETNQIGLTYIH